MSFYAAGMECLIDRYEKCLNFDGDKIDYLVVSFSQQLVHAALRYTAGIIIFGMTFVNRKNWDEF